MRSEASSTEAIPSHAISAEAAHTEAVSIEPTPVLQNSGAVFHLCSKLPLELRTMILRVLIDETRTIKVVHAGPSSKSMLTSPAVTSRRPLCQLEDKQIPALLHASKDTREIALKFYKAVSPDFLANPFYYNETFDTLSLSSAGIAVSKAIWWTNISEMLTRIWSTTTSSVRPKARKPSEATSKATKPNRCRCSRKGNATRNIYF